MAKIRKRTWKSGGKNGREPKEKTAWIADYFDRGKRHIKTFPTKKEAEAWLVTTRGEIGRGVHTPESTSITVAQAGELWIEAGRSRGWSVRRCANTATT